MRENYSVIIIIDVSRNSKPQLENLLFGFTRKFIAADAIT